MTPKVYYLKINQEDVSMPNQEALEMFCKQAAEKCGSFSIREEPLIEFTTDANGKSIENVVEIRLHYQIHTSDYTEESSSSLDELKVGWNNLCDAFKLDQQKDEIAFNIKPVATKEAIIRNSKITYDIFSEGFVNNMKNVIAEREIAIL